MLNCISNFEINIVDIFNELDKLTTKFATLALTVYRFYLNITIDFISFLLYDIFLLFHFEPGY